LITAEFFSYQFFSGILINFELLNQFDNEIFTRSGSKEGIEPATMGFFSKIYTHARTTPPLKLICLNAKILLI